uniref:Putative Holliday junction resolvase n=1 Tax=Anthurium amnicola TaxID=1678845 RepID=A0A1D1YDT2_9ARAE
MKLVKPIDLFQNAMKILPERRRLLGLDVGNKYIGLAVSDIKKRIASPLSVLVRKKSNIQLIADDFQKLVSQLQVEYFVNELRETGKLDGLHYTYWDEHYTSKCVESLLHPLALHPVEAKTMSDKFAAVGILQGYLDSMWRNQRPKTIPKK